MEQLNVSAFQLKHNILIKYYKTLQNVVLNYFYAENVRHRYKDLGGKNATLLHADLAPVTAGNQNTI
jgi:hypothetical protein